MILAISQKWTTGGSLNSRIVVLGVGNILLSDEGVGVQLLRHMQDQYPALDGVLYLDAGTVGLSLAMYLENTEAILILDAGELGAAPGTIQVFTGPAMDYFNNRRGRSAHEVGLRDLLAVAQLTMALPPNRALIVIQPGNISWGLYLSNAVAQALPAAARMANNLLTKWHAELTG